MACSSIANIAADILFVTVFKMRVDGVAWATFICQGISCILAVIFVLKRLSKITTETKAKPFSWSLLRQISIVAIPSIFQQSFISIGNIIIQGIINGFGTSVMAGYSAAIKLNNLVTSSLTTIGNGISNFTAQNLGAGKLERIKEGFRAGIKLVWLLCIFFTSAYLLGGRFLINIFMDDASDSALDVGVEILRILSPIYFIISIKFVSDGVLRGAGMMKQFIISTFSDLILRVVLAKILSVPFGATGIWLAWPFGWVIGALLSYIFYRSIKWKEHKL